MDDEEKLRLSEARYPQHIRSHQHFYQVQVSDRVLVRWCTSCGRTWKCERPGTENFFGDFWELIDERERK